MSTEEAPKGAILQRDKETYAIVPRIPCGLLTKEKLRNLATVVEKYDIPIVKLTSGHRIALVGMKADQINAIYADLGMDPGKATELCLHYVQACPGTEVCKFGIQDSLGFGIKLEAMLAGRETPAKLKVGVSGCPFTCAEGLVRDIGVTGRKKGWNVSFGGNSGKQARVGDILAEEIGTEEVITLINRCIDFYAEHGKKKERTSRFIERIGLDAFKEAVLSRPLSEG
ncbi:MAG: NAD(P)/FAD-dependent oxidoreductase [Desulfoprunum sp.]|jgi:NAD(P)H-nitrite reductase large subunit|uniref:NAD(P)/FAD-dependent oxidoreductase n=1 Tax=Desulfoprunum sp. TaxID=2020866 RepID=UPI00052B7B84|nr:sulfite reductase, assimilatory-type [Desulfobulbus sp. Tol-SR]